MDGALDLESAGGALVVECGGGDGGDGVLCERVGGGAEFVALVADEGGEDSGGKFAGVGAGECGGVGIGMLEVAILCAVDEAVEGLGGGGEIGGGLGGFDGGVGTKVAEDGQDIGAEASAGEGRVGVGVVFTPGLGEVVEEFDGVVMREMQHGANEGDVGGVVGCGKLSG